MLIMKLSALRPWQTSLFIVDLSIAFMSPYIKVNCILLFKINLIKWIKEKKLIRFLNYKGIKSCVGTLSPNMLNIKKKEKED